MPVRELDSSLADKGLSHVRGNVLAGRHGWYDVKEAFSPLLVQKAVESSVRKVEKAIDPFCGSGTVGLFCGQRGIDCTSVEINPFLASVARTKAQSCPSPLFRLALPTVKSGVLEGEDSPLADYSTFGPRSGRAKYLFNNAVLRSYQGGLTRANELPEHSRAMVQLALLRAAMENCNAERDGKCLRYKRNWQDQNYGLRSFQSSFDAITERIANDLCEAETLPKEPKVFLGDSREEISKITQLADLVITSPPYLNSFDYTDIYRPELYLGGFCDTTKGLQELRLSTLRSHVQVRWEDPTESNFGELYEKVQRDLQKNKKNLWSPRLGVMVQAYFEDMLSVMRSLRCVVHEGAHFWIVVSTSAYGGVEVPVDFILADIGETCGWVTEKIYFLRKLRSASHHIPRLGEAATGLALRETAVVLKAV